MEEHSKIQNDSIEYWKNEIIAFLAISSLKGVGYWTLRKIFESNLGFKNILKDSNADALSKFIRVSQPLQETWEVYQQELWNVGLERARILNKQGISLHFLGQKTFPDTLKTISEPPYWIFVEGNLQNLFKMSVAVVGTRKPTEDGMFLTKLVISALADTGIVTVSGLASGIDQLCHVESLRYGLPTVAVLGNGIFVEYPKGSNAIKAAIVGNGGTVITEYLPDQIYSAENFVRRNRLQAALSNALIPVEWKIKSGTAHTVEYAYKYNKKIANLYLPKTYALRPELKYSEQNRSALSFEVPRDISGVIDYILGSQDVIKAYPIQQDLDI